MQRRFPRIGMLGAIIVAALLMWLVPIPACAHAAHHHVVAEDSKAPPPACVHACAQTAVPACCVTGTCAECVSAFAGQMMPPLRSGASPGHGGRAFSLPAGIVPSIPSPPPRA